MWLFTDHLPMIFWGQTKAVPNAAQIGFANQNAAADIADIVKRASKHFVALFLERGRGQGLTWDTNASCVAVNRFWTRWAGSKRYCLGLGPCDQGWNIFDQTLPEGDCGDGRCGPYYVVWQTDLQIKFRGDFLYCDKVCCGDWAG